MLGVIDGLKTKGVETEADIKRRMVSSAISVINIKPAKPGRLYLRFFP
jgi:adenosine/AMP kinase